MSENTKIEWCDSTFNSWEGCQKVGPGCDNCYAENRNARFGGGVAVNWGPGAPRRRTSEANWRKPLAWNAAHAEFFAEHGRRQRVFCASLADVFDNEVPDAWRLDLFKLIADTPNLDWLILTKRIGNVMPMCSGDSLMFDLICERVWLGATICNQAEADRDIPKLLRVPAAKRFLSMEPLLGPVDLKKSQRQAGVGCGGCHQHLVDPCITKSKGSCTVCERTEDEIFGDHGFVYLKDGPRIDWVIVGGESGPNARPMHPDWARSLRDQCKAASVPFLFKQWGEFLPAGADADDPAVPDVPDTRLFWSNGEKWDRFDGQRAGLDLVARVGKKAAGRLLDGVEHNGFPT